MDLAGRSKYRVIVGAVLFQFSMMGILINTGSLFWSSIQDYTGLPLSVYTMFLAIKNGTGVFAGAFLSSLFFRTDRRKFMAIVLTLMCFSHIMWLLGPGTIWWYVASVVQGFAFATGSFMIPSIMAEQFPEKAGTYSGIAMASTGVAGVIFSPLIAVLLQKFSWQVELTFLSLFSELLGLAGLYLIFSKGATPFVAMTADRREKKDNSGDVNLILLFLIFMGLVGATITTRQTSTMVPMMKKYGYSLTVVSIMNSLMMVGNVGGKLLFGILTDKIGILKTMLIYYLISVLSVTAFLCFSSSFALMLVSSVGVGFILSIYMMGIPSCCVCLFSGNEIKKHLGILVSLNSGLSFLALAFLGLIVDKTGSYDFFHKICITTCIISMVSVLVLLSYRIKSESVKISKRL